MILTILRIMYLRLRNNPVELLLVFVMPVAFFSIFAAIFSNGIATSSEKKVRIGWIVQRHTNLASQLKDFLEKNSSLKCLSLITDPDLTNEVLMSDTQAISDSSVEALISDAQRSGQYDLIIRLPKSFPESMPDEAKHEPCRIHLVTDGQNPMALAMVTSVINGFVAQNQVAQITDQLITKGPSQRRSVTKSDSSSSEVRNRVWPEARSADAIQINRQKLIEPIAEPSQFCLRATRYLRFDGNPCRPYSALCSTSGFLSEANFLIQSLGVREPATDSQAERLVKPFDGLQQTMAQALQYRNSQYVALFSLASEWGQRWLDDGSPRKISSENKLAGEVSRPDAQRQSDAKAEQLLASTRITQSDSLDRKIFQIRVENPQSALQKNPRIAMYAAGIAVLFLLFSSTGNAATLLEEAESGTLDRIMVGKARILHIIVGKWLGIFFMGVVQISVMFLWAELVFQIQLWKHWDGFSLMTCCTSAATASLAILMATICRSRAQLNAISVVLILSMSAMGGSMIPRFAMSDRMKEIGQWTFNAWALDGYQKVFWYQAPIASLMIEVTVLIGSAIVMGCMALIFSQRWKCA